MAKTILELPEMPESCLKCVCCTGSQFSDNYYCGVLVLIKEGLIEISDREVATMGRRPDCPLKEVKADERSQRV